MNRITQLHRPWPRCALLFALAGGVMAQAGAQVYLCTDAQGHKELTDLKKTNACKLLDLPAVIKAPVPRSATARPNPVAAPAPPSATDFPRVNNTEQKARDGDRRQILLEELKSEEQRLAELKREFNGGEPERNGNERNYAKYQERLAQLKDNMSRTEKNVEALKREIATIR